MTSDIVPVGTKEFLFLLLDAVKQKQLQRTSSNLTLVLGLTKPWAASAASVDVIASRGCMPTDSACLGDPSSAFRFQCDPLCCSLRTRTSSEFVSMLVYVQARECS
jgi:hypothetical protein